MLLIIDNYDSFTYNLVQYFGELGVDPVVYRNDEKSIDEIMALNPSKIVISPGPGRPEDAGITESLIKTCYKDIPLLGVCLGHQAIGQVFGAQVIHAPKIMHGKTSLVYHDDVDLYKGVSNPCEATRYHSLIIDKLPSNFKKTAWTDDGVIMGIQHQQYPLYGIQFHPESILTKEGKIMLANFLAI